MHNRIAGIFYNAEQLMNLPESEAVPVEASVTQLNPLNIWVPRDTLIEWIEGNLAGIEQNRAQWDHIPERKLLSDALVEQRRVFLMQLASDNDPQVYIGLYLGELYQK